MDSNLFCYVLQWSFHCWGSVQQPMAEQSDRGTMSGMEQYSGYTSHIHHKLRATQQFVFLRYVFSSVKQTNESNTYCSQEIFLIRPGASCLASFFIYVSSCLRRKKVGAPSVTKIAKQISGGLSTYISLSDPGSRSRSRAVSTKSAICITSPDWNMVDDRWICRRVLVWNSTLILLPSQQCTKPRTVSFWLMRAPEKRAQKLTNRNT